MFKSFNTLYVVGSKPMPNQIVFGDLFQYIICCWFKANVITNVLRASQFQYIICCWFNASF